MKIIVIVGGIILALILIIVSLTLLIKNIRTRNRKPMTKEKFFKIAKSQGWELFEMENELPDGAEGFIAEKDNAQIGFLTMSTKDATALYKKNKKIFERDQGSDGEYLTKEYKKFTSCRISNLDKYMAVTRVRGTLLLFDGYANYQNIVDKFFNKAGY